MSEAVVARRRVASSAAAELALAMAIAGTIGVFVREAGVGAAHAVWWRCAIGAVVMLGYCWATGALRAASGGGRRDLLLVLLGGVCIVLNWLVAFEAFAWASITLVTIAYHVQPFFVLGLSRLAYGDRTSAASLAWVGLAFAGLVLAVGTDAGLATDLRATLIGAGLSVGAALLYGAAVVAAKGIRATPPALTTLAHTLIGVLILSAVSLPPPSQLASPAWPWLVGLGVLHTGLVYVLMYGAYPRLPAARVAVLTFVYPLTAIAAGLLIYGTPVGLLRIAGMTAIAAATLALNRRSPTDG